MGEALQVFQGKVEEDGEAVLTVKQMAERAEVTEQTIRNVLKEHPEIHTERVEAGEKGGRPSKGVSKLDFENQVMPALVQNKLFNGHKTGTEAFVEQLALITQSPENLDTDQLKQLSGSLMEAALKAMAAVCKRLEELNGKLTQELDQSKEWFSVKRMEKLHKDSRYDWRELKGYSVENGLEIKKVFDQNYGEVNAYHLDAWVACYGDAVLPDDVV